MVKKVLLVPHSVSIIVLQSHQRLPRQQQQDRQFQQRQYQPVSRGHPCLFKNTVNGKSKNEVRGLSNTEASIPTVSLVILFLPSVSVGTDGEMNTRSVHVQNPFLNEVVSIIARA